MEDLRDDSPFARVPVEGAGPTPMQETFTYDKIIASAGSGSLRGAPRWTRITVMAFGLLFVASILGLVIFQMLGG